MMNSELNQRRDLCALEVTLDGRRAKISGAAMDFATVYRFDDGMTVEFSWSAVWAVTGRADRNFKS
jgi:hypothetical protein